MSITKQGVVKASQFTNYWMTYIKKPVYIQEPDGSWWLQIYRLNSPTTLGYFQSTDTFTDGVYHNDDCWFNINILDSFNTWELLVKQKATESSTEMKYRWIQKVNPMVATYSEVSTENITYNTGEGYSTHTYGGMYKKNSSCYLSQHVPDHSGWWWGGIGPWALNGGSVPAWANTSVTTGYTEVYVRIDNNSFNPIIKAKIRDNGDYISNCFIEI